MPKKSEGKKIKLKEERTVNKKVSQSEFEKKVVELAKKGLSSEKIGEDLRRQGIHPKEYNKKISKILKENKMYENPDLKNIQEKLKGIKDHYEKNKQDKRAMRDKDKIFSQFRKLQSYFKVQ